MEPDNRHFGPPDSNSLATGNGVKALNPVKTRRIIDVESDIDPDELLPVYLETKTKLFHLQPQRGSNSQRLRGRDNTVKSKADKTAPNDQIDKLQRKLLRIEGDVLFDQYIADQQWEKERIVLERKAATERNAASGDPPERIPHPAEVSEESDDEVNKEAARIGAEILEEDGSDDDAAIADLFASLPVQEIDPISGKTSTVINGSDGSKVTIRDFGKTTGMSPRRVLEEACRAR
jgi:ATP-dependent RNA helicase DHX29